MSSFNILTERTHLQKHNANQCRCVRWLCGCACACIGVLSRVPHRCVGECFHDLQVEFIIDRSRCAHVCVHHLPVRHSTISMSERTKAYSCAYTLLSRCVCAFVWVLVFTSFSVHTQHTDTSMYYAALLSLFSVCRSSSECKHKYILALKPVIVQHDHHDIVVSICRSAVSI